MSADNVQILAKTTEYQGYFRIDAYQLRHRLHRGGLTGDIRREVFERGRAAAVLLYDPGLDSVVLVEQFRIGALSAGENPWVVEIVAGIIEEGETAPEVARREALEEAGCTVTDLLPIHDYLVSPGCSSETVSMFCGRVDASGAGGVHGLAEENEDIRALVMPADRAIADLRNRRFNNALPIIALQWLALERDAIRRLWLTTP